MTTSILLRPPLLHSPFSSPSPSPSPASTPLPALQSDLTSSSSSSTSDSYPDLHRSSSAPSTRRIRFAPLPEPNRDILVEPHDPASDEPQSNTKPATQLVPHPDDLHQDSLALSPSVSPDSTLSSVRSTPTIRLPSNTPKNTNKSNSKLFRPFSFLRRADSSPSNKSSAPHSASLPGSRNPSVSSFAPSSNSLPSSPSSHSPKLPRISTEDILSFGRKSLFRPRPGSPNTARPRRASSPPPRRADPSKSLHRSASTSSGTRMKPVDGKRDRGESPSQSHGAVAVVGSSAHKRRASSSALVPGAGGGRHTSSLKMLPNDSPARPSTSPNSTSARPRGYVKMLNGRVYGAKRYAAQTLANPFANVRDEPEFVEWGYGGMGSVHASAGIANDMWKGLQRSERGGALFAGSSFVSPPASVPGSVTVGDGRGSATSPTGRRKMSDSVPECGMGNVGVGGGDEDDGSGMAWVKKRRAEKEAKARSEQEAKEKMQEKRRSRDSMDASMYTSTASTTTSLTACTSAASTDLTTPTTSPLSSRSPSLTDLKLTLSPSSETRDLHAAPQYTTTGEQISKFGSALPLKDEHEHHVLTAVRLSPNILSPSRKHERAPLSPVQACITAGTNSSGDDEEESSRGSDEEGEQDDADDDDDEGGVQDVKRKTALGAGVEKISRHVDVEAR